ncbi:Metal-dependent hydrolase, endonuclease/exonuclease/phosphatase family [Polaribacter sp. KT25b]|uniref:endonuclease/exonuclease/phosphatase family protein n=1 Tax=Polaribacter sp. KT25b TaxID=1855336 RepID=UPI00087A8692|nr:endonuclease/exonuclease/phosphatase family protein [Polaribacter sp. KT25b]SDR84262.1 Metal-dependent hydrolase, endonuclease/exonuclease/phosphatase family [Polaribacter sp. KT25b]
MKKLSLFNKLVYIVNSLIATLLLLSFLLPYISPKTIPVFAILSLFVPFLIIINFVFVLYWLLQFKKQLLLSLIILVIGWLFITPFFKMTEHNSSLNDDVKVMSYNVRMFNHWQWIDDENISKKINAFITEKSPDILLFQEYYSLEKQQFNYPYKYIKTKNKKDKIGLAIYSKFPIINSGSLNLEHTSNNIIFADVLRKKDTIRVYNLHLQSLELNTKMENFGQANPEKLVARLKERFKQQAEQTEIFLAHEKGFKGKKIVAGDFNNTCYSWVYNQIAKNKKDTFVEAGIGFGKTYNYWFPMRIDFILTDENATVNKFTSFSEKNSDHFPIIAKINW